jgi:hypothetical protein
MVAHIISQSCSDATSPRLGDTITYLQMSYGGIFINENCLSTVGTGALPYEQPVTVCQNPSLFRNLVLKINKRRQ